MTVGPPQPDAPPQLGGPRLPDAPQEQADDASAFARAVDGIAANLRGAQAAEDAFADGSGTLQQAAYERARADVALAVATTAASRCAQAVQSLLNMQV
jgi:flagellar hook-basal body complex protein FliE